MHRTLLPALLGLALAPATHAATPEPKAGVQFQHNDWSLACDNTRTCRAAGYSPEQPGNLLSLMLERAGGPGRRCSRGCAMARMAKARRRPGRCACA